MSKPVEHEPRDPLGAVALLPVVDPDAARSRDLLVRAGRTLARQQRTARLRASLPILHAVTPRFLGFVAAGMASAGFIAAVVGQAVVVLRSTHGLFLFR